MSAKVYSFYDPYKIVFFLGYLHAYMLGRNIFLHKVDLCHESHQHSMPLASVKLHKYDVTGLCVTFHKYNNHSINYLIRIINGII